MKTKIYFFLSAVFGLSLAFSFVDGRTSHRYTDEKGKIEYELKNKMYDGNYCSYYKNGNKKCEGEYALNQRTGEWTLYDSLGKTLDKRTYKNNFDWTGGRCYQDGNNFVAEKFKIGPVVYNQKGFIDYFKFSDSSIIISKRIWRTIWFDANSGIFAKNKFIHMLADSVAAGKFVPCSNDELTDTCHDAAILRLLDTSNYQIAGYKIKEDWFYDKARNVSETRIISICPFAYSKKTAKVETEVRYIDLGWFYFPQLRNAMAQQKADHNFYPVSIKSLDDIFFFRDFHGDIYKESNIKNQELADYATGSKLEKEQERIEMNILELEEDAWLSTFK